MKFPTPPKLLTVKTLREYLDEMEKSWTDEDTMYMGEFEHHKINIICYKKVDNNLFCNSGVGPAKIIYDGGLDFIIMEDD